MEETATQRIIGVLTLYSELMQSRSGKRYYGWNPSEPEECKAWNEFARAAEAIRRLEADPRHYLLAQFHGGIPLPSGLYGPDAANRYKIYEKRRRSKTSYPRADVGRITVEESYTAAFNHSAYVLKAYASWGIPREEVYREMGNIISPYFILCDPDNSSCFLEDEPPDELKRIRGLQGAWTILKAGPELRKRLQALWRTTCPFSLSEKPSSGSQTTPPQASHT